MIISKLHFLASNLSSKIPSSGENTLRSSCHEVLIWGARVLTPREPRTPHRSARLGESPKRGQSRTSAGRPRGGTPSEAQEQGQLGLARASRDNAAPPLGLPHSIPAPAPWAAGRQRATEEGPARNPWRVREAGPLGPWLTARGRGRGGVTGLGAGGRPRWVLLWGAWSQAAQPCGKWFWSPGRAGETSFEIMEAAGLGSEGAGSTKPGGPATDRPLEPLSLTLPRGVAGRRPCPAFLWAPLCARYQACRRRERLSNVLSVKHDSENKRRAPLRDVSRWRCCRFAEKVTLPIQTSPPFHFWLSHHW